MRVRMMKKTKRTSFSTSIPAVIDSILPSAKGAHTTMAKLKVFYKGITGDGRRFTEDFAVKLLSNLPETPVVAFYDEEEGDFIGHAEKQGVFGYVPENAAVYFEEIDGKEWAVTDVKLFTEREDVGSVAKKIIGKQHSLELNPETIKFDINENKNEDYFVSFLDGELIGLSVLGDWQTPAFGGSGFFSQNNTPVSLDTIISNYLSLPKEIEVTQNGGETMFLEFVEGLHKDLEIKSVLEDERFLIYRVGDKTYIALKDGEGIASVDITPAFAPVVEATETPEVEEEVIEEPVVEEEAVEENTDSEVAADVVEQNEAPILEPVIEDKAEGVDENVEQEQAQPEIEGVEPQAPEVPANSAALSEAEREELENYRRKDKEGMIAEYTEYLPADKIKEFKNSVDNYTIKELEEKLSVEAMKFIIANKEQPAQDTFTRSFVSKSEPNAQVDGVDVATEYYLRKDKRGEN